MIRPATPEDLPDLLRMAYAFHKAGNGKRYFRFEDEPEGYAHLMLSCMEGGDRLCIVADEPVRGFLVAMIAPLPMCPRVRVANEILLWVDPDARGDGTAREMLRHMKEWGRERGCKHWQAGSQRYLGMKSAGALIESEGGALEEKHYVGAL